MVHAHQSEQELGWMGPPRGGCRMRPRTWLAAILLLLLAALVAVILRSGTLCRWAGRISPVERLAFQRVAPGDDCGHGIE